MKSSFITLIICTISLTLIAQKTNKHYNAGVNHYNSRDYKASIKSFEKAIKEGDKSSNTYYFLAKAYQKTEDFADAETAIKRAIDIDGNFQEYHFEHGLISAINLKYNQAVLSFKEAIAIDENFKPAWYNLGLAYKEMRLYDYMLVVADQLLILDKDYGKAYYLKALAYEGKGEDSKKDKFIEKAIRLDPSLKRLARY